MNNIAFLRPDFFKRQMKLINSLVILRISGIILLILAFSFLLCVPVAAIYNEPLAPFLLSAAITLVLSLFLLGDPKRMSLLKITTREGFLSVTLSWFIVILFGTLPFIISGSIRSFVNAFFESCSGFTTTGSSVISDIEALPYSILFWRSLTHWIGGLGIIVLMIIILPSLKITGYQLFRLESSLQEKLHPKTKAIGFRFLFIYLAITIIETILLYAGDMNLFDSICHAFSTVATGGFSTKNTSLVNFSPYSQYVITLFMFLSGVSYVVYYYLAKLNFRRIKNNDELWFYTLITIFSVVITTAILFTKNSGSFEETFREASFQVVSVISCTGFGSADYLLWPSGALLLLFFLMFAGGSTGSTSGGIKMARHLVMLKNIRSVLIRISHQKVVSPVKLNQNLLSQKTNISVVSFILLYVFIFMTGTIIVILTGVDPVSSAGAVAASLANLGPGLGSVGPMSNYGHLHSITKIFLCLLMIVGRLEIYTVFILLTKSFWRL